MWEFLGPAGVVLLDGGLSISQGAVEVVVVGEDEADGGVWVGLDCDEVVALDDSGENFRVDVGEFVPQVILNRLVVHLVHIHVDVDVQAALGEPLEVGHRSIPWVVEG